MREMRSPLNTTVDSKDTEIAPPQIAELLLNNTVGLFVTVTEQLRKM